MILYSGYFVLVNPSVISSSTTTLFSLLRCADIIYSQQQARTLNRRLDALHLDCHGLPHAVRFHVCHLALIPIHTPTRKPLSVLCPQLGEHANGALPRVLDQSSRNYFHGLCYGTVRPLRNTLYSFGLLTKPNSDGHLGSTATGTETRMEDHITSNAHCIVQVAFDFVEDVFGGSAKKDGAGVRVLAFGEEGEVLVANFGDFEEPAFGAHVRGLDGFDVVDDSGASGAGNAVVVSFADAAEGGDVVLD